MLLSQLWDFLLFWSLFVVLRDFSSRTSVQHVTLRTIESLSKDVFERCTSTGSDAFSLLICLDASKIVLLTVFTFMETVCPKLQAKPLPRNAKRPAPVDVCRSKTPLLPLANLGAFFVVVFFHRQCKKNCNIVKSNSQNLTKFCGILLSRFSQ